MSAEQDTEQETDTARPQPGPGNDGGSDSSGSDGSGSDGSGSDKSADGEFTYGEDETQDFVDRSVIDFDPADGLYTGSAVTGESDIPGPSEAEIREAQEGMGEDADGDSGAKAAAEKFIEENDVDLDEARKGEAIAGSAQSSGDKGDDS